MHERPPPPFPYFAPPTKTPDRLMEALTFPDRSLARFAGWMYLIISACGLFAGLGVREAMLVPGDPAATAAQIAEQPFLFRLGFVADLLMVLCDVAVGV
ncbi:MAG: DUF4386 domain-containing protein, partial [Flavobacteriales bacterium]|nr:DUF4386 domain-containing protein [Flavobacteriales bacterium]